MNAQADIDGQSSATLIYATATISFILAVGCYHYYTKIYTHFKLRGIRGPTPYPLIGNLLPLLTRDRLKVERDWTKTYGKFYGIFRGLSPAYVINDAELLHEICIKNFAAFPNHGVLFPLRNKYQDEFLIATFDDHWRRLRAFQSPLFTSCKIKRMYKLIDICADDLVLNFKEKLEEGDQMLEKTTVNLKEIYSMYTMDAIATSAYSIKLNCKLNGNDKSAMDEFLSLAKPAVEFSIPRIVVTQIVPHSILKAVGFNVTPLKIFTDLDERLKPIVRQRQNSGKKTDDYLQILVDARIGDKIELNELDERENHHAALTHEGLKADQVDMVNAIEQSSDRAELKDSKLKLTDHEIISNAIFLLLVGHETTATLLTHCSYALAFHPKVQERLYELIKSMAKFDSNSAKHSFDYDELISCDYLDAVISETLRCIPVVIQGDRLVGKDHHIERYDVTLKRGEKLLLNFYAIMNNSEYWPDPLRFDPERFMGENKKKIVPGSYCPFGLGPRHCLGMRFSLIEAKLAIAKVLTKFKFTPAPGTRFPPESGRIFMINSLKKPIVQLTSRC